MFGLIASYNKGSYIFMADGKSATQLHEDKEIPTSEYTKPSHDREKQQ